MRLSTTPASIASYLGRRALEVDPTKQRVIYRYGEISNQLDIWLEDYNALSWFGVGKYDLEIFQVLSVSQSALRWREINAKKDQFELECDGNKVPAITNSSET